MEIQCISTCRSSIWNVLTFFPENDKLKKVYVIYKLVAFSLTTDDCAHLQGSRTFHEQITGPVLVQRLQVADSSAAVLGDAARTSLIYPNRETRSLNAIRV